VEYHRGACSRMGGTGRETTLPGPDSGAKIRMQSFSSYCEKRMMNRAVLAAGQQPP
jgi:hypothetical protein